MREGVLFEFTKDHLESGFQGVPAGYCVTSHVDPKKGLSYAGRPISGLCARGPEEVIYLLYRGELGTKEQVNAFYSELTEEMTCPAEVVEKIYALPKINRKMDVMAAAILIAGMYESKVDYAQDCLGLIAKMPHLVACVMNSQNSWGDTPDPISELGYIENFAQMLRMPGGKSDLFVETLKLFSILHFDHGGGNLSAFVGKAVSSGLENMYGCIASAMSCLGGPRHGDACQSGFAFVSEIANEQKEGTDIGDILKKKMEERSHLPGFGHAVLQVEDPRAKICYEFCQEHFADQDLVQTAFALREKSEKAGLFPNVDAITGVMLHSAGFTSLGDAPLLFGLARCVGISVQIVYERLQALDGKGTPIMRPSYIYKHRL